MIRFIDLFCGIGGFRLGLERANKENSIRKTSTRQNLRSVGNSSNDSSRDTWKHTTSSKNFCCVWSSDIDKYAQQIYKKNFGEEPEGDITKIPTKSVPDHDLLCAGFPCQAFSIAGKRKGFQDTRGTLFFDITRILSHKRPRYFLLENVDGLLSDGNGETFQTILRVLTDTGYLLQSEVLNSKNYSVPQSRKRVFLVGHLRGERRPEIFPIGEVCENGSKGKGKKERWSVHTLTEGYYRNCRGTYLKYGNSQDQKISTTVSQSLNAGHFNQPKIDCGAIRRLTPIECERLQGFPDNWTEGVSDTQRYKLLGNAVTVNVIEFLGERLIERR